MSRYMFTRFTDRCSRRPPGHANAVRLVIGAIVASLFSLAVDAAMAQNRRNYVARGRGPAYYSGWYSPVDALAARVHAQAHLVRASGAAAVDYAAAREIRADAIRKEIRNSVERVSAYWERRNIGEAERARRHVDMDTLRRRRNGATWQHLKNHPDLNGPAITSGRAMNFLMYRLSSTVLMRDVSKPQSSLDQSTLSHFQLSPEVLRNLRLRQNAGNGEGLVFRATEGIPLDVNWWPFVLRGKEFDTTRRAFTEARQAVVADAADGNLSRESMQKLELALLDLSTEYRQHYTRKRRLQDGIRSFQQARAGEVFLESLDFEIARLQTTGAANSFDQSLRFDPKRDGSDLLALVQFMARGGLEFAPVQPGEEPAYFTTFQLMRDLYLTVAEDDEGANVPNKEQPAS